MNVTEEIRSRLESAFSPRELEVVNESYKHAGHAGDDGTGESHFHVMIRADELAAQGRVARHRAVMKALGDIPQRIHALALDIG